MTEIIRLLRLSKVLATSLNSSSISPQNHIHPYLNTKGFPLMSQRYQHDFKAAYACASNLNPDHLLYQAQCCCCCFSSCSSGWYPRLQLQLSPIDQIAAMDMSLPSFQIRQTASPLQG